MKDEGTQNQQLCRAVGIPSGKASLWGQLTNCDTVLKHGGASDRMIF